MILCLESYCEALDLDQEQLIPRSEINQPKPGFPVKCEHLSQLNSEIAGTVLIKRSCGLGDLTPAHYIEVSPADHYTLNIVCLSIVCHNGQNFSFEKKLEDESQTI